MSSWRIAVRALHELGGEASLRSISEHVWLVDASAALNVAAGMGLAMSPGRRGRRGRTPGHWSITQRGIDWCEGRITLATGVPVRPGARAPMRFVATWLSSLPRDIRLGPGA